MKWALPCKLHKAKPRLVVLAFLCVAKAGIGGVLAYEIIDTRIPSRNETYWLDDHRVLFSGYDNSRLVPNSINGHAFPQAVLYIWDLVSRQAKIYADIPETDYVCYSDGFISYAIRKGGERWIREGTIGSEREERSRESSGKARNWRNELTCKLLDLSELDTVRSGFWFIPLRNGHGYYGGKKIASPVDSAQSSMLYLPNRDRKLPIELPFKTGEKDKISYSEYLGAYQFEYTPRLKTENSGGKLRSLYVNGTVKETTIPPGPWMNGSVGYASVRDGTVMWSRALSIKKTSDPGAAGLYFFSGHKTERLLIGYPGTSIAISKDGCRIAIVLNPHTEIDSTATLRIIDLCKKGGEVTEDRFGILQKNAC